MGSLLKEWQVCGISVWPIERMVGVLVDRPDQCVYTVYTVHASKVTHTVHAIHTSYTVRIAYNTCMTHALELQE